MPASFSARSWLFAPADSERKMQKAADGPADAVIFDLEDSVAPASKPAARERTRAFLDAATDHDRLWVRINPLNSGMALDDLAQVMPGRPGGIMLPKSEGRADLERLSHYLSALEAANGIEQGATKIIALVTETAAAMFTTGEYRGHYPGSDRLVAMSWGAEDLSSALGSSQRTLPDGSYTPVYELARNLCLLGAVAAEVAPIETIMADFRDLDGLKHRAEMLRRSGFRGMLAIHPAQVEIINAAFTPGEEELARAREVVALFAANPEAGAIGHEGAMLDRPHLLQAQALLALAR
ncbi:HpcH/HpaI aldolase/citrate lyase family protein [Pseudopontixanthobacter vadosimaris]|uniref:HpcH/HpaI aldolase/citrate lyase family protein n=1 Tax=Pseudopontixanthobacter vadosimaris TaxID=2726450 RepID=UPI0014754D4D